MAIWECLFHFATSISCKEISIGKKHIEMHLVDKIVKVICKSSLGAKVKIEAFSETRNPPSPDLQKYFTKNQWMHGN